MLPDMLDWAKWELSPWKSYHSTAENDNFHEGNNEFQHGRIRRVHANFL